MGDLVTRPLVRLRDLEGHSVTLVLADGSHLDGVTLVSAGRGGARSRKGRRLAPALRPYGTGVPWPRGDGGTGPAGSAVRPHGSTAARTDGDLCALSVMSVAWTLIVIAPSSVLGPMPAM